MNSLHSLLAPGTLTAEDLCRLVVEATGKPCSRQMLHYWVRTGRIPRPAGKLGTAHLWFEDQLAPLDMPPERIL